jgi:hypothetical protein
VRQTVTPTATRTAAQRLAAQRLAASLRPEVCILGFACTECL